MQKNFRDVLGRLIGMAGRAMRQRLGENLAAGGYNISAEQMILMVILSENEGVNQQTLTDYMPCEKTAMTRWIDSLESKCLAVRVPDSKDRRQKRIFLTKEGKATMVELRKIARLTEKNAIHGVDPEKVAICKEVLRQVRRNLE
jgi:DNA-binding MarR family transcriptional regulator